MVNEQSEKIVDTILSILNKLPLEEACEVINKVKSQITSRQSKKSRNQGINTSLRASYLKFRSGGLKKTGFRLEDHDL